MKKKNLVVVLIVLVLAISMSACSSVERPEECKFLEGTEKCLDRLNGDVSSDWKDAVEYTEGGSGPADPAAEIAGNQTAVDHANRLIVENADLDVRACFPSIGDDDWRAIAEWATQWGSDSPTRIEWQVNESRCSFVFPGNITDSINSKEYAEIVELFSKNGYTEKWFVGGDEGAEFGRGTYDEILKADPTFNRLHIYGHTLSEMPVE